MEKTTIESNVKMHNATWFGAIIRQRIALVAVAVIWLAVGTAPILAQSPLSEFGFREADVESRIVSALMDGSIPIRPENRKAFHAASQSARAACVRSAFPIIKAYTESAAFQTEYAERRAAAKPAAPAPPNPQETEYLKEQQKSLAASLKMYEKSMADMKSQMAKMPPHVQQQMESAVKRYEEQCVAMQAQYEAGGHEQQAYKLALSKYEELYPADPKMMIANRLRAFLELTNDIPYNAELVPVAGGNVKFADPQLEAKSPHWKKCYRAGKEPVEAARELAMEWLKQLEK